MLSKRHAGQSWIVNVLTWSCISQRVFGFQAVQISSCLREAGPSSLTRQGHTSWHDHSSRARNVIRRTVRCPSSATNGQTPADPLQCVDKVAPQCITPKNDVGVKGKIESGECTLKFRPIPPSYIASSYNVSRQTRPSSQGLLSVGDIGSGLLRY